MNRWKSNLTCSYCNLIFNHPIELPCDDSICKEHLKEKEVKKQNKIKCNQCKQEFEVKGLKINVNKTIKKQIDNKLYLNDEEIALKQKIEESIKFFYEIFEEFTLSKNALDLECNNHFQEIRRQLDLHREQLKEKIDDIYIEMIDYTKKNEASYLKYLNEGIGNFINYYETKSFEENLKELEERFRDPHILIKTIEEMNLKQQEAIAAVQLNLKKMAKVIEDLKASNKFEPFLSFRDTNVWSMFGQLNLKEYSFDPLKSQILTCQQPLELIKLCEFDLKDKFKLLYRASQDGFGSNNFHSKCDGKANTLTILKANGFIFGGFTTASWDGESQSKSDPNAFLFSLTNKQNKPCKMKIRRHRHGTAIFCDPDYGPTFGRGDIEIVSNSNTNETSSSVLGDDYKHPKYAFEAKAFLADSFRFQLSEIEVYEKE